MDFFSSGIVNRECIMKGDEKSPKSQGMVFSTSNDSEVQ